MSESERQEFERKVAQVFHAAPTIPEEVDEKNGEDDINSACDALRTGNLESFQLPLHSGSGHSSAGTELCSEVQRHFEFK